MLSHCHVRIIREIFIGITCILISNFNKIGFGLVLVKSFRLRSKTRRENKVSRYIIRFKGC